MSVTVEWSSHVSGPVCLHFRVTASESVGKLDNYDPSRPSIPSLRVHSQRHASKRATSECHQLLFALQCVAFSKRDKRCAQTKGALGQKVRGTKCLGRQAIY